MEDAPVRERRLRRHSQRDPRRRVGPERNARTEVGPRCEEGTAVSRLQRLPNAFDQALDHLVFVVDSRNARLEGRPDPAEFPVTKAQEVVENTKKASPERGPRQEAGDGQFG